jgi:phytoene/squalene synthetase
MRLVDDLVDEEGQNKDSRLQALKDFRLKTRLALAGRLADETHPVMSKLHIFSNIRPELFDAMMDGQESDLRFEQPQDFDALLKYCDQVASSVGELVLELLGEPRAELAQALGRSLQLLNICRDLREDFERGRIYLPRSWVAAPQPEWADNRREFLGALFKIQDELNTQLTRARQLEHELEKPISRTFVGLIRKAYDPWWQRLLSNPSQFLDPMPRLTWLERLRGLF